MTQEKRLSELLAGMKMTCKPGAPDNETFADSDGWTCTLRYDGRSYTLPFYMGRGHNGEPPEVDDVMDCVLSDAAGYDGADGFDDWAGEYGYDTDSRAAEKVYKAVEKGRNKLARLLGDEYETFLYAERD